MATAVAPLPTIDIRAASSYPVRLGSSILRPSESQAYRSVRYNHKPRRKGQEASSGSIEALKNGKSELSLQDGSQKYNYEGQTAEVAERYVLLTRGSGKDKELVLEKVGGGYDFNLTGTPFETDAGRLAQKYQHLPQEDEDQDDLFGDEDEANEPVDEKNPFDFRNHLKVESAKARPDGADTPQSAAGTPRPAPRPATSTPIAQPKKTAVTNSAAQKKRKNQEPLKPNPKRVKAGTEPPPPASSKPKAKDVPSVRLDRKASVRRPSFDDSGELILENETPTTEKPPRAQGAMALALSGQLGQGPISLRSAASSPASRNASPMPARPDGVESPAEFELGESSPEASAKKPRAQSPGDYFSNAEEDEEDADADVEDLELPSPRQRRKSSAHVGYGGGGGDDDYDMERELELALAQDDGGIAQPTVVNESDEESEEE